MAKKPRASDLSPRPGKDDVNRDVQYWLDEIQASKKREKHFREQGVRIREIYSGGKMESTPMNILFSNTETIAPALYSQIPRPVVRRRYKDNDPMGLAASKAAQRILEFLIDTDIEGYDTFDDCLKSVTLDGLLPGRGVTTLKYDAVVEDYPDDDSDDTDATIPVKKPDTELVCPEIRSWDRVYFGYATKWSRVPWVAYEEHIDKKEATRLFGAEKAKALKFSRGEISENEGQQGVDRAPEDERDTGGRKTALIYQIWDRLGGRKIRYIAPTYKDGFLLVADDELNLTGFFNCPKPVQFVFKTDDMRPASPYLLYENQAKELNELSIRITKITRAIKARGVYDTELGDDIANIMEAEDNQLVPADKSSSLAAEKGLQNAIWFMPLDVLISTLKELFAAREQCKQVIYEITGISDIIRGASKASETLGAQQIKSQWGALRIKPKQYEVQRYACDLMRIMVEIAAHKFSQDTWAKMTGLPYLTDEQYAQGQKMAQAAQQQLQEANQGIQAAQAQLQALGGAAGPPQPGAPQDPNAPPPDPVPGATPPPQANGGASGNQLTLTAGPQQIAEKVRQKQAIATKAITLQQQQAIQANQQKAQAAADQLQQLSQAAQQPKWSDVLKVLNNDIQREFRIDIETNSTIEPEAAEDQKNISDLMQALSQFLQSVGPMVAQGIMPFQVAQSMLLAITRRFRFGDEIEEMIQQMQPPAPQDQSKEALQKATAQLTQLQQQLAQKDTENQKAALEAKKVTTEQASQNDFLQKQGQLKDEQHKLQLDKLAHQKDKQIFEVEKKHAAESMALKTQVESGKLDHKKVTMTDGEKTAKVAHHLATGALTQIDQKVTDAVHKVMGDSVAHVKALRDEVAGSHAAILRTVEEHRKGIDKVVKKLAAPRKKRAVRGPDGRIEAVVDEPVSLDA